MIQYILECIAFQLVFLIIYDLFLKHETFFQWNRAYLIGTYVFSMILPWVKIEALKTSAPEVFQGYPDFLWHVNDAAMTVVTSDKSTFSMPWEIVVLFGGMLVATVFLAFKLLQIYKLRQAGEVRYFKDFTRIVISNSALAFSFFKSIFLGDKVFEKEHQNIVAHELVHIRERHSYDLMFFELMRIVAWFNPLVYVYQNRVSELHEYIADAKVAKTHKKEQYQFLLSQVFQTQNISFINQFFKSSLIKKRIVMLQKSKSKKIWQLKYLMLLPMILALLIYTSCEVNANNLTDGVMLVESVAQMSEIEEQAVFEKLKELENTGQYWEFTVEDKDSSITYAQIDNGSYIQFNGENERIKATMVIESNTLSDRINDLRQEIESKDSLTAYERDQLALMIYKVYPEGVKGISGEKGALEFLASNKNSNLRYKFGNLVEERRLTNGHFTATKKYDQLVAERQRLLKSTNEKNPIIVSLDEQLDGLQKAISQEDETVPFAKVDQVPVFPGCEEETDQIACFQKSMQIHISKNFNYPKEAQEKGIQGRVNAMFTIAKDGAINNLRMRGPDSLLENEVARIIKRLPKMKPGVHKGKEVNVPFSIPVTFKLNGNKSKEDIFKLASKDGMEPLHIIDGKRSTKKELMALDQNNIESMHVLKGEAAQKKYGEAGKNGVIEVITKRKD